MPEAIDLVANKASVDGIDLTSEVAEGTPIIQADSGQLQQVLVNLLNNAIDAVTKGQRANGGQIRVEVRPVAGGVEISVADNGCGINQKEMAKVFTPFFTTKPVGKGTGLGLSVCYGIIDKMGGRITVRSEEGKGATFTIYLPAAGLSQVG